MMILVMIMLMMMILYDDDDDDDDVWCMMYDIDDDTITHFTGDGLLEGFDWLVNDIGARIFLMA